RRATYLLDRRYLLITVLVPARALAPQQFGRGGVLLEIKWKIAAHAGAPGARRRRPAMKASRSVSKNPRRRGEISITLGPRPSDIKRSSVRVEMPRRSAASRLLRTWVAI